MSAKTRHQPVINRFTDHVDCAVAKFPGTLTIEKLLICVNGQQHFSVALDKDKEIYFQTEINKTLE